MAEVISYRLRLSPRALERLVGELRNELPLMLEADERGLRISPEEGESFLRFRIRGEEAVLTEVCLANDEQGLFFQRVLGPLMVRYQGDLQARLVWSAAERNTQGAYAHVSIRQGSTTYPGLSRAASALRNTLVAASAGPGEAGSPFGAEAENAPPEEPSVDEELLAEVQRLLERGKADWEEYQRLKSQIQGR
jgi:hypothetical protein